MPETVKTHWKDRPEYTEVYEPWAEGLISGAAAQKIFSIMNKDWATLESVATTFAPNLNRLSTTVACTASHSNASTFLYDLRARREEASVLLGENIKELTISSGDTFSTMLRPDSTGWKVGFAEKTRRAVHPLLGEGFSYSPELLLSEITVRETVEMLLEDVADNIKT